MRAFLVVTGLSLFAGFGMQNASAAEMGDPVKLPLSILEKAGAQGLVRVIVTVDHSVEGGNNVGSSCVNDECAKLEVANAMLPTEAPIIEMLPGNMILMEATPAGLDVLQKLPQVVSVVEDGVSPINESQTQFDAPNEG